MVETGNAGLAPVRGKARIDVLDMLRGLAILGIFYINVPYMAASVWTFSADVRLIGWTAADRDAWWAVNLFFAGTQRCLLEFLFGAGMMVLARKAMEPDGPVAVADLYYRRNLWLLAFGLFDVFVLLWPGDILHIYALAALFLFPFRTLGPKTLVVLGLGWAVITGLGIPEYGAREYVARTELVQKVEAGDPAALTEWRKLETHVPDAQAVAREHAAHQGGWLPYAKNAWRYWSYLASEWLVWDVLEAFCTMLIGVALWKWGVIHGLRSARFYLWLMVAGYGFGLTARWIGLAETLSFSPGPRSLWITGEFARMAIGLGHLALVNLAVKGRTGAAVLGLFKAPGRMAFSLYFLQQIVGMYILFAPWGFNLWGRFGWAEMAAISTIGIVALVAFANLWMRHFVSGPLEWAWRSLAYVKPQPFRRAELSAPPQPDHSPLSRPASAAAPPAAR
ncbi:uncharacterized protein HNP52_002437 [Sphingomonas kyeonggiensis]|uniref:DUF418 domain-containing protein n=1 Tax=Sphingomonas kyeonggiensis TaxID=1268553 RepID=A0A7W7K2A9_9SPHN|nr:DUF418 domain-containing protein [Sphingomonas kyeonggiensis]MBB4839368.1 uncharacterized protein [Sphingomonas kyeonggiensis]